MRDGMAKTLRIPHGVPIARHKPNPKITVPGGETPFFHPDDPDDKKLQQIWHVKVRVFDLSKPEDVEEYQQAWQKITDGQAVCSEQKTDFDSERGTYIAFLRWAEFDYRLPENA